MNKSHLPRDRNGYEIVRVEGVIGLFWAVRGTGRSFLTLGDARRFSVSQPENRLTGYP